MEIHKIAFIFCVVLLVSCTKTSISEAEELLDEDNISFEADLVELSVSEQELFDLVNEHRNSIGLTSLEYSGETYVYAYEHNKYMISKGKLSHDNFDARATQVSKVTSTNFVAENVAKNYQMVEDAFNGWLGSTSHRNTMEGDFTHATLSITLDNDKKSVLYANFLQKVNGFLGTDEAGIPGTGQ